ncbi:uncharacterized protein PG986_008754 [Apiospora aurea]|uniref:Uncharacterized protein n=1 Tax=Apiospora aurea TaxID=335848 RepID=A0ABR1Q5T2_9PEZI
MVYLRPVLGLRRKGQDDMFTGCRDPPLASSQEDSACDKYGRVWGTDYVVVGGSNVIPSESAYDPYVNCCLLRHRRYWQDH